MAEGLLQWWQAADFMDSEAAKKGGLFCRFGDGKEGAERRQLRAACSSVGELLRHRPLSISWMVQ